LSDAFKKGVADTKAEIGRFAESVRNFFGTFANQLRSAFDYVFKNNPLLNELKSMKELITRVKLVIEFISTLFQSIPGAFVQIRDTINAIADKFNGAIKLKVLQRKLKAAAEDFSYQSSLPASQKYRLDLKTTVSLLAYHQVKE